MPRSPQGPFHHLHKRLVPAKARDYKLNLDPTYTAGPQIALEEDLCPPHQSQSTHKDGPRWRNHTGLPRAPQGPFTASHKRLAPAVGKGFHTTPGPTDTAVSQVALGADQSLCQWNRHTNRIWSLVCWNLIPDSLDQVESQMDSNAIYYFELQTWNLALQPA